MPVHIGRPIVSTLKAEMISIEFEIFQRLLNHHTDDRDEESWRSGANTLGKYINTQIQEHIHKFKTTQMLTRRKQYKNTQIQKHMHKYKSTYRNTKAHKKEMKIHKY